MAKTNTFVEVPRSNDKLVFESNEDIVTIYVAVDTSASMKGNEAETRDALCNTLNQNLMENPETRGKVYEELLGFDDIPRILSPLTPVYDIVIPEFECGGCTCMHEAVEVMVDEVQANRRLARENHRGQYKPWLVFITDGMPTDQDKGQVERLRRLERDDHWNIIPYAIGPNADLDFLSTLREDGRVFRTGADDIKSFFAFLGDSLTKVSTVDPGQEVRLPPIDDYEGLQIVAHS